MFADMGCWNQPYLFKLSLIKGNRAHKKTRGVGKYTSSNTDSSMLFKDNLQVHQCEPWARNSCSFCCSAFPWPPNSKLQTATTVQKRRIQYAPSLLQTKCPHVELVSPYIIRKPIMNSSPPKSKRSIQWKPSQLNKQQQTNGNKACLPQWWQKMRSQW